MVSSESADNNYAIFRECVSSVIAARSDQHRPNKAPKRRAYKAKSARKKDVSGSRDQCSSSISTKEEESPEELADFIDFIASEIFTSLPDPLQNLSYSAIQHSPVLAETYNLPLTSTHLIPLQPASDINNRHTNNIHTYPRNPRAAFTHIDRVHTCGHPAATGVGKHAQICLRDLRERLDPAELSPPYPEGGA
ncbi:hypothetical protein BJX64DRAFT_111321 [Aspergillus heterothallicus]